MNRVQKNQAPFCATRPRVLHPAPCHGRSTHASRPPWPWHGARAGVRRGGGRPAPPGAGPGEWVALVGF